MAKVGCDVDSCLYWGKGNICVADAIMVKNNKEVGYAMEIGTMGETTGVTSAQTMCETFKPKKSVVKT